MKKLLLIASTLIIGLTNLNAQTSIEVRNNDLGGIIANNAVLLEDVAAGAQSLIHVSIKNIGSTTKTYGCFRTDITVNPASTPGTTMGGQPYFCFGGQCFPNSTYTATPAYYVTLNAGQNDVPTQIYLDEDADVAGYSEIKYTFYDVNNPNDAQSFTIKYNPTLQSVKENSTILTSISEVYPNPSATKAQININSKATTTAVVSISNALGSTVSTKNVDLSLGKNNIQLDSENLPSGIYFATISANNSKIVKKFTVNK